MNSHALDLQSKTQSLHTAVAIQAAEPPTVLVKPSIKGRAPFLSPGAGQLSTAVNTKLGEDLSGCLLTTAGGSRVTENRLSSRLIRRKLLLAVANIQKASTKNIIYFLRCWKSLSCER